MKLPIVYALLPLALTITACGGGPNNPNPQPNPTPAGWGDASTITAAQLKGCPLADTLETGKVAPGILSCTKGSFNGIVDAGSTQKCSLTMNGNGTMTFTHPALSHSIMVTAQTNIYTTHKIDNGLHTVMLTFETDRYDTEKWVNIGFSYLENATSASMPNIYMSARVGQQKANCYTRI